MEDRRDEMENGKGSLGFVEEGETERMEQEWSATVVGVVPNRSGRLLRSGATFVGQRGCRDAL